MPWDKNILCLNCGEELYGILQREDGESFFWCKLCGSICCPNSNDSIGTEDYCAPELTKVHYFVAKRPTAYPVESKTSLWSPHSVRCVNCGEDLRAVIQSANGNAVLWCCSCGTLCCPNAYDPISVSDW